MVNLMGAIPEETMPRHLTWREIADDIAARIYSGEYPPGEPIPSYSRIADLYSVSISTAAKAVARLHDLGLLETDPGRANIVADHPA